MYNVTLQPLRNKYKFIKGLQQTIWVDKLTIIDDLKEFTTKPTCPDTCQDTWLCPDTLWLIQMLSDSFSRILSYVQILIHRYYCMDTFTDIIQLRLLVPNQEVGISKNDSTIWNARWNSTSRDTPYLSSRHISSPKSTTPHVQAPYEGPSQAPAP